MDPATIALLSAAKRANDARLAVRDGAMTMPLAALNLAAMDAVRANQALLVAAFAWGSAGGPDMPEAPK